MAGTSIGKLSKLTGCNVETIRYYERIGLLPAPPRSAGGHRLYGPEDIRRLRFVRRSRDLGFSVAEVRRLLQFIDEGDYTCAEVRSVAFDHLAAVRRKVAALQTMEGALTGMIAACDGGEIPECAIIDTLYD